MKKKKTIKYCTHRCAVEVSFVWKGRAVVQAVSCWLPTVVARVRVRAGMWGLWWTKRHLGRFSPSTSLSPANHLSTNFSIIIITQGWHSRPIGGCSAKWTQFGLHPPLYQNLLYDLLIFALKCLNLHISFSCRPEEIMFLITYLTN
jgi:hypothetical protein